jgi:hypothetical protein
MDELISELQQLPVEVVLDEGQDSLEQGVERRLVGADHGNSQTRPLKQILISDLGAGDFKLGTNASLEASDDHSLFFEAAAAGEVEVEDRISNDHGIWLSAFRCQRSAREMKRPRWPRAES